MWGSCFVPIEPDFSALFGSPSPLAPMASSSPTAPSLFCQVFRRPIGPTWYCLGPSAPSATGAVAGGMLVQMDEYALGSHLLLTNDPTILTTMNQRAAQAGPTAAGLLRRLVREQLDLLPLAPMEATQAGSPAARAALLPRGPTTPGRVRRSLPPGRLCRRRLAAQRAIQIIPQNRRPRDGSWPAGDGHRESLSPRELVLLFRNRVPARRLASSGHKHRGKSTSRGRFRGSEPARQQRMEALSEPGRTGYRHSPAIAASCLPRSERVRNLRETSGGRFPPRLF